MSRKAAPKPSPRTDPLPFRPKPRMIMAKPPVCNMLGTPAPAVEPATTTSSRLTVPSTDTRPTPSVSISATPNTPPTRKYYTTSFAPAGPSGDRGDEPRIDISTGSHSANTSGRVDASRSGDLVTTSATARPKPPFTGSPEVPSNTPVSSKETLDSHKPKPPGTGEAELPPDIVEPSDPKSSDPISDQSNDARDPAYLDVPVIRPESPTLPSNGTTPKDTPTSVHVDIATSGSTPASTAPLSSSCSQPLPSSYESPYPTLDAIYATITLNHASPSYYDHHAWYNMANETTSKTCETRANVTSTSTIHEASVSRPARNSVTTTTTNGTTTRGGTMTMTMTGWSTVTGAGMKPTVLGNTSTTTTEVSAPGSPLLAENGDQGSTAFGLGAFGLLIWEVVGGKGFSV